MTKSLQKIIFQFHNQSRLIKIVSSSLIIIIFLSLIMAIIKLGHSYNNQISQLRQYPLVSCHNWQAIENIITDEQVLERIIPLSSKFDLDFAKASNFQKTKINNLYTQDSQQKLNSDIKSDHNNSDEKNNDKQKNTIVDNKNKIEQKSIMAYDAFLFTNSKSLNRKVSENILDQDSIFQRQIPATHSAVLYNNAEILKNITLDHPLKKNNKQIYSFAQIWQDVPELWFVSLAYTSDGYYSRNSRWNKEKNNWQGEWKKNSILDELLPPAEGLSAFLHPAREQIIIYIANDNQIQSYILPFENRSPSWSKTSKIKSGKNKYRKDKLLNQKSIQAMNLIIFCQQNPEDFTQAKSFLEESRQSFTITPQD